MMGNLMTRHHFKYYFMKQHATPLTPGEQNFKDHLDLAVKEIASLTQENNQLRDRIDQIHESNVQFDRLLWEAFLNANVKIEDTFPAAFHEYINKLKASIAARKLPPETIVEHQIIKK